MTNQTPKFALLPQAIAIVLLTSGLSFAQSAETSSDEEAALEQIVVTGTRSKNRTTLDTPVPVDVLTREDIRKAGVLGGELGQALGVLLPSFNFPRQSNSGAADHVRAAQIRGMSPDQVLVLINGKRRHTSAVVNLEGKIGKGTTPVDFNAIPISSIARIEVLRDGAGAQYGSDAIAGVINVILDSDDAGGYIDLSYGAHSTDFDPIDDRITDGQTASAAASYGFGLEDGFFRFGAEFKNRNETNRSGFDQIPFFEEQTPANLAFQGQRNYRPGDPDTRDAKLWSTVCLR
jgi:iron complex outermembrane recepter protein